RSMVRRFWEKAEGIWKEYPRSSESKVYGHRASGAPGRGRWWKVSMHGGELMLVIDSQSGVVGWYQDNILTALLAYEDATPLTRCLSQQAAFERAVHYAQISGVPLDAFVLDEARLWSDFNPQPGA